MCSKNIFCIYPHMGMGDQLICNGLVRNICGKYQDRTIILFCESHTLESIKFMYSDVPNIDFACANDYVVHCLLDDMDDDHKIYIGHHHLFKIMSGGMSFDQAFYKQVGLTFQRRWTDFRVVRDLKKEDELFNRLNLVRGSYVFLHDDPHRGLNVNRDYIKNKNLNIFVPSKEITNNIFYYIKILENASEIHCMDSCFKLLADSVLEERNSLFFHINLVNGVKKDPTTSSQSKLSWVVI